MNDDIKSMIKSRRDQRYHGSAYKDDRITKAVADYMKVLQPILSKIKNKEPLTPEEEDLVYDITWKENRRTSTQFDEGYMDPAYKDGEEYARRYLEGGEYEDLRDLDWDTRERDKALSARFDEIRSSHSKEIGPYTPEGRLRGAIRNAVDRMGTEPRALLADWAKNNGSKVDSGAFGPPDDEGPGYYDY